MESFPVVIKTLDALHLATVIVFSEKTSEHILIFSYDEAMNRCSAILGFQTPLG